jgi:outer membrane protein OmpA-like peptidoglycan-associated protein
MNKHNANLMNIKITIIILLAVFMTGACASTTQVVLLPNPDGKVGSLEVSSEKGTDPQTLDKPWQATETSVLTGAPGTPKVMDEKEVREIFGQALAARPLPPVSYIMYFSQGSAELTADSENLLLAAIEAIALRSSTHVTVIGHSDSVGSAQYNDKLSGKRSQAVVDAMVARGVDKKIIEVTNHGKANPLIPTPDGVPEPRNRRVEINIR